jgi:mannose-6-phosphate isomerase-like protein (cupin superfamily)
VARAGQTIENPVTGERVTFLRVAADTGGALLELEDEWPRPGHRAVAHVHPAMEETWEVLAGAAAFRIGDREMTAGPGETVVAPAGVRHEAWNAGATPVRLRVTLRPALRWEEFTERLFALFAGGAPAEDLLALVAEYPREIAMA